MMIYVCINFFVKVDQLIVVPIVNGGVRLIQVSFKVNKWNKFGEFGYCPPNTGYPLNTGFTVYMLLLIFGAYWSQFEMQ